MASLVFKCIVFVTVLCLCGDVFECKHYRRHDLHRIVLKSKNKNRFKKPLHPNSHHHYHFQDDVLYNPYLDHHAEPSHHFESFEEPAYASSHHFNRFRDHDHYKERHHFQTFKPYQQYDFDRYNKPTYPSVPNEYKSYRDMMEEYNRKQEEDFRLQLEKAKHQMHYMPQQQPQESFNHAETQERPIWNNPTVNNYKGDWSPISYSEPSYNPSTSFVNNNPTFDAVSTTTQPAVYTDFANLDFTTSTPQKFPSIIVEKNMTKGHSKHKTINYNFDQNYFPNHKPAENAIYKEYKEPGYEVNENAAETTNPVVSHYQNSAVVGTSYSTLWTNPENNTQAYKPQMSGNSFGSRTKARRNKRPAYPTQ